MKRLPALAGVLLVLSLPACGSDGPATDGPKTPPTTSATTPSPEPTDVTSPASLVVSPGAVGPAKVGMTKAEAVATGLFDADVKGPVEGCGDIPLQWKKEFSGLDVLVDEDGAITSIGITKGGPRTAKGVGVGSTLAELTAAYPKLSPVVEAGFGQAGAYEYTGDQYIGFLFGDATVGEIDQDDTVSFMEVTVGKPDLMRSGC